MADQASFSVSRRSPSQTKRPRAAESGTRQGSRTQISAFSHYFAKPLLGLGPLLFAAAVIASLSTGWVMREEEYLSAKSGVGYWLGIVGSVLMLILLLFPLRKRYRFLRGLGRVPSWFRSHMLLGVIGPTLIIFHANFRVGSLNSSVAPSSCSSSWRAGSSGDTCLLRSIWAFTAARQRSVTFCPMPTL